MLGRTAINQRTENPVEALFATVGAKDHLGRKAPSGLEVELAKRSVTPVPSVAQVNSEASSPVGVPAKASFVRLLLGTGEVIEE
jgi:hypothetical protein